MDITKLQDLFNKAVDDYSQLTNPKQNPKWSDFINDTSIKVNAVVPPNPTDTDGMMNYALNFMGNGLAGTVKQFPQKYLDAIKDFQKNPNYTRRWNNANDMNEYYDLATKNGVFNLHDAFANKSKGKGQLSSKLTGFSLKDGLVQPNYMAASNLQEPITQRQLMNMVSPMDTKLGHTLWSTANKLGGVMENPKIIPNSRYEVSGAGPLFDIVKRYGLDPNSQAEVIQAYRTYMPRVTMTNYGQDGYRGIDMSAKVHYPPANSTYPQLKEFLTDLNSPFASNTQFHDNHVIDKKTHRNFIDFLRANGITDEEIMKYK